MTKNLPPPRPPRPDFLRRPRGPFGWLDASLLKQHWLKRIGPHAVAVLTLFALAADGRGASFYRRETMAAELDLDIDTLDQALARLLQFGIVAFRPWRPGHRDGVWQILPVAPLSSRPESASMVPTRPSATTQHQPVPLAQLLRDLGVPEH